MAKIRAILRHSLRMACIAREARRSSKVRGSSNPWALKRGEPANEAKPHKSFEMQARGRISAIGGPGGWRQGASPGASPDADLVPKEARTFRRAAEVVALSAAKGVAGTSWRARWPAAERLLPGVIGITYMLGFY